MSYLSQDQRINLSDEKLFEEIAFQMLYEKEEKSLKGLIEEQAEGLKISEQQFFSLKMFKRKW